jgi:hypothetical protein
MSKDTAAIDCKEVESSIAAVEQPSEPDNTLEPAFLPPSAWTKQQVYTHLTLVLAFGISYLIAVFCFALFVYLPKQAGTKANLADAFCDQQVATGLQRRFAVDVHICENLTFAQAKLIDVVWDSVVGQTGQIFLGYVLAKFVVSDFLVWTMERSGVPYHVYTNLSFSTVSIQSVLSIGKLLLKQRDWRTVCAAVWLPFAIFHVLVFPTIWSAATSYVSPSVRMYGMPDGALVSADSSRLTLCFIAQDSRVGWNDTHIELGPTFADLGVSSWSSQFSEWPPPSWLLLENLETHPDGASPRDIYYWDANNSAQWRMPDTFKDIQECEYHSCFIFVAINQLQMHS